MSLTADFGPHSADQPSIHLASSGGWSDVLRYVETLDGDRYSRLGWLCELGWQDDLGELRSEIEAALADVPPGDPTVAKTLGLFAEALREHEATGVVVVSGGIHDGVLEGYEEDE